MKMTEKEVEMVTRVRKSFRGLGAGIPDAIIVWDNIFPFLPKLIQAGFSYLLKKKRSEDTL